MIQARIRDRRDGLLTGRGPGAPPAETARWMRERPTLGDRPSAVARQDVADQATLARADAAALSALAARTRARLSVVAADLRRHRSPATIIVALPGRTGGLRVIGVVSAAAIWWLVRRRLRS